MILAVAEQQDALLKNVSWEAIAAAQQLSDCCGAMRVAAVVLGSPADAPAEALAAADVSEVLVVDQPALASYTADGFVAALQRLIATTGAAYVVLPHTYQTRDLAPRLAARLSRPAITDVVAVKSTPGRPSFARPLFQGKLMADVVPEGEGPAIVTVQVGAFKADSARRGAQAAPIRRIDVAIDAADVRQVPEPPFRQAKQAVDLTQAERIVSVGRGLKDKEKIPLAQELAAALGAEVGASRPVCDAGWLPLDRQVGSSGQTVAPKLYVALGISGAIQHVVGIKGAKVVVAINKDAAAPIFEIADIGIVGDLFEIVPALIAELRR